MGYGIKESKELVKLGLSVGNALGKSMADGQVSLSDAIYVLAVLKDAPAAFVGVEQVPAELQDLSDEEYAELVAFAKEQLDIPQDSIESSVELALEIGLKVVQLASQLFVKKA